MARVLKFYWVSMAYAFVQAVENSFLGSATSLSSTALHTTAGNLLVVFVTWDPSTNPSATASLSDPAANSYTPITPVIVDATNGVNIQAFYCKNANAISGNQVTFTLSATNSVLGIAVLEYSGNDTTAPLDGSHSNLQATPGTGTGGITTGNATNTKQPALVLSIAMADGATSYTPAAEAASTSRITGWDFGLGTALMRIQDKRTTATGGIGATFTAAANSSVVSAVFVFDETGAAGGGTPIAVLANSYYQHLT